MTNSQTQKRMEHLQRIKEFGDKAAQVLLFLSFALVSVATLKDKKVASGELQSAMQWWSTALFPVVLSILPLKEFAVLFKDDDLWFQIILWLKFALMWLALALIFVGAVAFTKSIPGVFQG